MISFSSAHRPPTQTQQTPTNIHPMEPQSHGPCPQAFNLQAEPPISELLFGRLELPPGAIKDPEFATSSTQTYVIAQGQTNALELAIAMPQKDVRGGEKDGGVGGFVGSPRVSFTAEPMNRLSPSMRTPLGRERPPAPPFSLVGIPVKRHIASTSTLEGWFIFAVVSPYVVIRYSSDGAVFPNASMPPLSSSSSSSSSSPSSSCHHHTHCHHLTLSAS